MISSDDMISSATPVITMAPTDQVPGFIIPVTVTLSVIFIIITAVVIAVIIGFCYIARKRKSNTPSDEYVIQGELNPIETNYTADRYHPDIVGTKNQEGTKIMTETNVSYTLYENNTEHLYSDITSVRPLPAPPDTYEEVAVQPDTYEAVAATDDVKTDGNTDDYLYMT